MNARVDHLLEEILSLPADERSAVATALIDSLEGNGDTGVNDAWRQELLRRRDDLRTGRVVSNSWTDVRARLGSL